MPPEAACFVLPHLFSRGRIISSNPQGKAPWKDRCSVGTLGGTFLFERQTEIEQALMGWACPVCWNQEMETQSESPTWVTRTRLLEPSLTTPGSHLQETGMGSCYSIVFWILLFPLRRCNLHCYSPVWNVLFYSKNFWKLFSYLDYSTFVLCIQVWICVNTKLIKLNISSELKIKPNQNQNPFCSQRCGTAVWVVLGTLASLRSSGRWSKYL